MVDNAAVMGDDDSVPTTLSGAVSVDTQRLEGIFQAVIGRLDQQGAQIQALAVLNPLHHHQVLFQTVPQDALVLCGSGEEVATITQRLDSLESQVCFSLLPASPSSALPLHCRVSRCPLSARAQLRSETLPTLR